MYFHDNGSEDQLCSDCSKNELEPRTQFTSQEMSSTSALPNKENKNVSLPEDPFNRWELDADDIDAPAASLDKDKLSRDNVGVEAVCEVVKQNIVEEIF